MIRIFLLDVEGCLIRIRRRRGARGMSLRVASDGRVTVTAARWTPLFVIEHFVRQQEEWIQTARTRFQKNGHAPLRSPQVRRERFFQYRDEALALVQERVSQWSQRYGFTPGMITVRDQRTRWGSCSSTGKLSFNYRILFLPERLQEYVIVHELCHLQEMNHSPRFWVLLESILPDALARRQELRTFSLLDTGHEAGL